MHVTNTYKTMCEKMAVQRSLKDSFGSRSSQSSGESLETLKRRKLSEGSRLNLTESDFEQSGAK